MSYIKTNWEDRKVEYPNRYKDQYENILTLTQEPGEVACVGTPVDAEHMNHLEEGVYNAQVFYFVTTLIDTNWTLNETTNLYEYNVTKEDITESHYIKVKPAGLTELEKFNGNAEVKSYNGGFKITSTEIPEENINVVVTYQLVIDVTPTTLGNSEVSK